MCLAAMTSFGLAKGRDGTGNGKRPFQTFSVPVFGRIFELF